MPAKLNRVGLRYGRLVVEEYVGKDHRNKLLWKCKCDCGNEKIVVGDNLSSGRSRSCGCLNAEFLKRKGNQYATFSDRKDAIWNVLYSELKKRHKKFSGDILSFELFKEVSSKPCAYCGTSNSRIIRDRRYDKRSSTTKGGLMSDTTLKINGIDRIDSGIGYTKENCVPCCPTCNCAKNAMTQDDFKQWIRRVYKHLELDKSYFEIAKNRIENTEVNTENKENLELW